MNKFQEALAKRIAEANAAKASQHEMDLIGLLDNPNFIESQRSIQAKQSELSYLNTIINQLNSITPFVANDGHKYRVTVYPINSFGLGLGEVMGIINNSSSAFTDELMLQYTAITGISEIELASARVALGSPMYCTKDGRLVDAIPGNFQELQNILQSIAIKLNLHEFNPASITQAQYDLWFAKSELSARRKADDIRKDAVLDTAKFTMDDE